MTISLTSVTTRRTDTVGKVPGPVPPGTGFLRTPDGRHDVSTPRVWDFDWVRGLVTSGPEGTCPIPLNPIVGFHWNGHSTSRPSVTGR